VWRSREIDIVEVDDIFGCDWGAQAAGLSVSAASRDIRCLRQQARWRYSINSAID